MKVAVFEHPGKRKIKLMAYTMWYSSTWPGICMHKIFTARNGTEAKKLAMQEHRERCMNRTDQTEPK